MDVSIALGIHETAVSEIKFWNFLDSQATSIPGIEKGMALVSGFSNNLLTLFLDNCGVVNLEVVMDAAISSNYGKRCKRRWRKDGFCDDYPQS